MLTHNEVAMVERLLNCDMTHRAISRAIGISRGTISTIARGEHCSRRRRLDPPEELPTVCGPPRRCPRCRLMMFIPDGWPVCRACNARNTKHGGTESRIKEPIALGLELQPEHRRRYEQVRAARRRAVAASNPRPAAWQPPVVSEREFDERLAAAQKEEQANV